MLAQLLDWLFATILFGMVAFAGWLFIGGDLDTWRLFFLVFIGGTLFGHRMGHRLGVYQERAGLTRDEPTPTVWYGRDEWI